MVFLEVAGGKLEKRGRKRDRKRGSAKYIGMSLFASVGTSVS